MERAYQALELMRLMKQEVSEREDVKQSSCPWTAIVALRDTALMNTDQYLGALYKRAIDAASDLEEFMSLINV